ncbi:Uma2 family endonuclease [Streptomyces sp. I05A-00742]|uniref:Uma2 family endonuclease n=1 Tax=Streptomyces sp. I05A-00742 TaxID=2732853 RepID=UPI001487E231|nr:Uma2 family endonuclease [Streptomyces sp. I05A-00742]
MTADPITEPVNTPQEQDPIDMLAALDEAAGHVLRAEFIEGTATLVPPSDRQHNFGAFLLAMQLHSAGLTLAGIGDGYTTRLKEDGLRDLIIPDFAVLSRKPTDTDEEYRKDHRGWYSIDLVTLAGEITSSNHESDTGPKYRSYAAVGVPVYVLIHRLRRKAFAFSDPVQDENPVKSRYATKVEVDLGMRLPLPDPYPVLDTSALRP